MPFVCKSKARRLILDLECSFLQGAFLPEPHKTVGEILVCSYFRAGISGGTALVLLSQNLFTDPNNIIDKQIEIFTTASVIGNRAADGKFPVNGRVSRNSNSALLQAKQ